MRGVVAALLATVATAACIRSAQNPAFEPLAPTGPDLIEQVVFLIGDGGESVFERSPLEVRLQQEVERWAADLGRPEAVAVLYLGDNVYPDGVREVPHPGRAQDSIHLRSQAEIVNGPNARRFRARGYFVAGNHDWGQTYGLEGLVRLREQEKMLDAFAQEGMRVDLYPDAGFPGPQVVDAGDNVRFVFLDTHWWLQADHDNVLRDTVFFSVEEILRNSGQRAVVFASHHPLSSGGAHGGPVPIWRGFGILWLLKKTGSLVQDLNSPVFRELQGGLQQLFAEIRRPLIYVGGHDHSLQVIEETSPNRPQWTLVSGSVSKLTDVGPAAGMRYGDDLPGFMRLSFRRDGGVELHVFGAPAEYQHCGDEDGEDVARCMAEGPQQYVEVYSSRLREPHSLTETTDSIGAR